MAEDRGTAVFQGLIDRGYSPVHAAALAGHVLQESGGRADALNPKEGANGLIQWRLDRWQALQDFAKSRGTSPTDRDTQLDFIGHEMNGTERRAGTAFRAATDLPSASAALKQYIRFGDDSAGTRLTNASKFLGDQAGMLPPQASAPVGAPVAPAPTSDPLAAAPAPTAAPASPIPAAQAPQDEAQTQALAGIAKMLQQNQPQAPTIDPNLLPPHPTPGPTLAMQRARQMAQAMINRSLNGGAGAS